MAETKTKTLMYKRCSFHKGGNDLEKLLKQALQKHATVGSRRQSLAPKDEPPIWLLIGQQKTDDAFVFGLLVQYTPGTSPSFLVEDASAANLDVEHLPAPKTLDGKDRELLDAMLFFAVSGNHMVMMQSQSLKSLQLERHLQWLLHESKTLAGDDTLKLTDHLPKTVREALEASPIRSLVIGGELVQPSPESEKTSGVSTQDQSLSALVGAGLAPPAGMPVLPSRIPALPQMVTNFLQVQSSSGSPAVLDMLKGLVGPSKASQLNLDKIDGANIEYSLQIRYKRQTTDDGQKFMNGLGAALRHAEGIETKIRLASGGTISGEELRLSGPIKITTVNGVPNPDDVFEAMRTWLLQRVKSGDIGG